MPHRRILSLWFPRLAAERYLRMDRGLPRGPFAVVREEANMQVISSLSAEAEAAGLRVGQPLGDALAICPALLTRPASPAAEAAFLAALRRWAGKFSPWVAEEPPAALVIDLTGCAHLFGGEEAILEQIEAECADLELSIHAGIADTRGAAWALARFAGQPGRMTRTGDAIDQEARATRARAARRRNWERGGPPPRLQPPGERGARIAPPGRTHSALAPLPVEALRLDEPTTTALNRLGLRRVEDLMGMPRAALSRRFGRGLVQRLDQALGSEPEPISPARPELHFAVRLTLPDLIGLEEDILAGLDRMLPVLSRKLQGAGQGARRVRLHFFRADHTVQALEVGLARPSADPDRIRPLLAMKLGEVEAGFGIDVLRIEAHVTEPVHARQHRGHMEASAEAARRQAAGPGLDDLIGRIGARVGLDAITRLHPADSHIPEKTAKVLAAAWSEPAQDWPASPTPRPLLLWRPEPVHAADSPALPLQFRWRGRNWQSVSAQGPERIAPEWWLDDPDWRSGVRDYWQVTVEGGERLWLYYAHGAAMSSGWFCHGAFA
ncbi:MAG: DNA polymerase Y family protein [Rhodobacteraceae bacterium]|nr:DNA polymerase Y family protein [Paracoccaceae bacterium]